MVERTVLNFSQEPELGNLLHLLPEGPEDGGEDTVLTFAQELKLSRLLPGDPEDGVGGGGEESYPCSHGLALGNPQSPEALRMVGVPLNFS